MKKDLSKKLASLTPEQRVLLEKKLREKSAGKKNLNSIPVRRNLSEYPLSFAQRSLWFLSQLNKDSAFYNMPSLIEIIGKLNFEALENSINDIIERHEILRSNYIFDNEPKQKIKKDTKLKIRKINIEEIKGENENNKIELFANEEGGKPFDLAKDSMIRANLIKANENKNILIVTFHHIVADGWSLSVFVNEIIQLYTAYSKGETPVLPKLKIQYADFAKWQKDKLDNNAFNSQIDYWKKQLANLNGNLNLPLDKPRPGTQTFNGMHKSFYIEKELYEKVKEFGKQKQTTMFVVMLSIYQALLYRYTSQEDISVGSPIAYRDKPELQNLIGFFINTLVFRSDFSESLTFTQLIKQVHKTTIDAFANKDIPFEKVVDALKIKRTQDKSPLFQTLFVMQNTPSNEIKIPGLTFRLKEVEIGNVKFDLTLSIEEKEDHLENLIGYNTNLFNETTIDEFIKRFKIFFNNVIKDPDTPITKVPLITENEKEELIAYWSKVEEIKDLPPNLHTLFENQATENPNAIALEYPIIADDGDIQTEYFTYSEINKKANVLANYLINENVKPDSIIALSFTRSPEMIITMLGILKSGAAYLPIDVNYPEDRKKYMLEDSDVKILITEELLQESYKDFDVNIIMLATASENYAVNNGNNPSVRIKHNNLAYVIYTSGSTGNPKGVTITHKSVVNYIMATSDVYGFRNEDRVLQFSSISFDAAAEEIYHTFYKGATLILRPEAIISSPKIFLDFSERINVTVWDMPTAYWHQLVQEIISENRELPNNLHALLIGGERIEPVKARDWLNKFGNKINFFNTYGPTETTIVALFHKITTNDLLLTEFREVPIGKPVKGLTTFILDENMNPIPKGFSGELCIGGIGLAKGYLNKPEITEKSFISNPFGKNKIAKIYRTGDKVRMLDNDIVEYLGRIDDQVKIRGFRIELKEINNLLLQNAEIREAITLARKDNNNQNIIITYYVLKNEISLTIQKLRSYLKESLPEYMIPAYFIELEALPLTPNGKIDTKKLLNLDLNKTKKERTYKNPTNELEIIISELWSDILDIKKIGIDENFFELGGNSLRAAVFINNLQKKLGKVVWVVSLFDNQTIEKYSNYLILNYYSSLQNLLKENSLFLKDILQKNSSETQIWVTEKKLQRIKESIAEKSYLKIDNNKSIIKKNKQAAFILSAPRSGSTLLRVMLSGNPNLFVPPELALLTFEKLKERGKAFHNREKGWSEGLTRAVMQIHNCDYIKANNIISEYENKNLTVKEFYNEFQKQIGSKLLVDKTTTYASNYETLNRAEDYFENAKFIHIVRHPSAMIQSYLNSKLNEVFGVDNNFNERESAELFWILNNQNILNFLKNISADRKYFLHYENLVTEPEKYMKEISDFLEIPFDKEMLYPYNEKYSRMTDGIHPESHMVGDPRFHEHKEIESKLASKWQELPEDDFLSDITINISKIFKYKISKHDILHKTIYKTGNTTSLSSINQVDRNKELTLSYAQQRIWFLEQLEPGNPTYNIPGSVKIKGKIDSDKFNIAINKIIAHHESLRTIFPSVEGKAKQVIIPKLKLELNYTDLRNINELIREDEAKILILNEAIKPFNLAKGPLLRWKLIQTYDDEYILLVCMHHIISDGWSVELFVKETAKVYLALVKETEINLSDHPIEYVDYAYWQKEWMDGELYKTQIDFWKDNLKDVPPLLELPTDFARASVQNQKGNRISFEIDNELTGKLHKLSIDEGTTLYSVMLTVFNILLNKYSNSNDIIIGTPVAGRVRKEFEELIGLFVNTLIIRTKVNLLDRFNDLLRKIGGNVVQAISNQEIPFEKLLDELNVERSLSYSPLFQVMFVYNQSPLKNIITDKLTIEPVELNLNTSKFDITLSLTKNNDSIIGVFEYNTSLFKHTTIARMIEHYKKIIFEIVKNKETIIDKINIITEIERNEVLNVFNNSDKKYKVEKTLHQIIEEKTQEFPESIAITLEGKNYTYFQLNNSANKIAKKLAESDNGNEERLIGIYMERGVEMIAGILGILKAGYGYLPIDPVYPNERLSFMLEDAKIKRVITQERIKENLPKGNIELIVFDENTLFEEKKYENLNINILPEDLAYCIYTSGSTGKPKGTLITHKNVVRLFNSTEEMFHFNRKDVWTLFHSFAFDFSVWEIFGALFYGGKLVIIPHLVSRNPEEFYSLMLEEKVTVLNQTPSAFRQLIEVDKNRKEKNTFLRCIIFGGEALELNILKPWINKYGDDKPELINMYGITETTVHVTYKRIKNEDVEKNKGSIIGKPIKDLQVYILDKNLNVLPIGIPGEIFVGGDGVAEGYLNRERLTKDKFIENPYQTGNKLYKTGDLAKYDENGELEYLGRIDNQVKIRGFRIELGEIEKVLDTNKLISKSLVLAIDNELGSKKLVGYLIADKDKISVAEIRKYVAKFIPGYMIPAAFVYMEKYPLTPNGKINRKALPKHELNREDVSTEFVSPTTEKEIILAKIVKDLLKIEKIGVDDNFFELGGDSIIAIQMIAKANKAGIGLSPKDLFMYPNIRGLASVAKDAIKIYAEQELLAGKVLLAPIQKWFFEQNLKNSNHWNQSLLLEVDNTFNEEAFKETIRKIIQHHDALRMQFEIKEDIITQHYLPELAELPFEIIDLSGIDKNKLSGIITEKSNEVQASLNLEKGKVFKCVYFKTKKDTPGRLLIIAHHLVIDGVSWRILTEDLITAYEQINSGNEITLQPKTTSFAYWTKSLTELAESDFINNQIEFWEQVKVKQKQNAVYSNNMNSSINTEKELGKVEFTLEERTTNSLLQEVPRVYNTEITEVLLTALVLANAKWKGSRKMGLSLEGHGREPLFDNIDISRTIGWFTGLYPVVLDLGNAVTTVESLKNIKESLRKIQNNGIAYGILKYFSKRINQSDFPHLSEISFNYLGQFNQNIGKQSNFKVAIDNKGRERAVENLRPFLIDIVGSIIDGKLQMIWVYNKKIHSKEEIVKFSHLYKNELVKIIEDIKSEEGGYTPSDFKEAELDEEELDSIFSELDEDFEDE